VIDVTTNLSISENEIGFIVSRSGGPGGQNVNKVSTRVTLQFDVSRSTSLNDQQRERIRSKLAGRINKDGILQITSQRTRNQEMNRQDALQRFIALISDALRVQKQRVPTRVTRAARAERLQEKKKRTQLKQLRSRKGLDEQ
jgi:ribosome-associated protein